MAQINSQQRANIKQARTKSSKTLKLNFNFLGILTLAFSLCDAPANLFGFNFDGQNLQPTFSAPRLVVEAGTIVRGSASFTLKGGNDFSLQLASVAEGSDRFDGGVRFFASTIPGYVLNLSRVHFEVSSSEGAFWDLEVNVPGLIMGLAGGPTSTTLTPHDVQIIAADYQAVPSVELILFVGDFSPIDIQFDNVTVLVP